MSNIFSDKLVELADYSSTVKSPVGYQLSSLLRSMSQLSDAELLALELPVIRQKVTVWDSLKHDYNDALDLPRGRFYADFGFKVEQSVSLESLAKVIDELKEKGIVITARTQAAILVNAQLNGLLQDWVRIAMFG